MNKRERLEEITRLVNKKGTVRISEIVKLLNVTDMTVRRDFIELEEQGVLTKIHGGARSNKAFQYREYSHSEKLALHFVALIAEADVHQVDSIAPEFQLQALL